ncbi:MAG: PHP domain-containing protein [Firmicutes bacterium]|nr:PHP domain-containing protein [Bacillota bacterium]
MIVDLHVHSNISDGDYSPRELVIMARDKGVSVMALTDHDSVHGVPQALLAGEELGVFIIPGMELSTDKGNTDLHILGFYIDMDSMELHRTLDMLRAKRMIRCKKILKRLRDLGMEIPLSYVLNLGVGGFIGRGRIFKAMVNLGFARSHKKYGDFQRYLGKKGLAYVEHEGLSPEEAIRFILDCRGIPVLAHPRTDISTDTVERLISVGLEGVEAYHPSHSRNTCKMWLDFAKDHDLVVTGGSDFHRISPDEPYGLGSMAVPPTAVYELTERWLKITSDRCI